MNLPELVSKGIAMKVLASFLPQRRGGAALNASRLCVSAVF